jgi:O-6-methylguanine DNA methyltransferase
MPVSMKGSPRLVLSSSRRDEEAATLLWGALRPRRIAPHGVLVFAGEQGVVLLALLGESTRRLSALAARISGGRAAGPGSAPRSARACRHLENALDELDAYFRGSLRAFHVPVDIASQGTAFQRAVWTALLEIPFGSLRAYADVAATIGMPSAARAVGGAVGRNPVPIIVPCHRVVGRDGSLTGFSSGLPWKRILLEVEGIDGFRGQR